MSGIVASRAARIPATRQRGRRMSVSTAMAVVAGFAMLAGSAPAFAQDANTQRRLDKVESEVRALQRKVFPGGDGTFFPQITPPPAAAPQPTQAPSATPMTDMLSRVDAVERQLAQLTSQVEQNTNRLNQLEGRMNDMAAAAQAAPAPVQQGPVQPGAMPQDNAGRDNGPQDNGPSQPLSAGTAPAPSSGARADGVKGVEKPQTGNPGQDAYSYGFRLWSAKYYPEAQQQLKQYLAQYPKDPMVSYGRNLLGRAYLDDGNPTEAAKWFLQNYQSDKTGARAADSLLYLGVSMKALKDTRRACIALDQFSQSYTAEAAGRLKDIYDATRRGLTCN
ncbi:tetratricopeptide repeat protein [Novosphingobium sp. 9]|uniref:tetratricopeptide repeat protein n=1 Tax=Novosphingobium sp. 9 TaxID=2025349 RepID=UPI0021B546D8|nr:tetratricopeptide repeat protein [Novosphingobium sp. 9]